MRKFFTVLLLTLSAAAYIHAQERLTVSVAVPDGISSENAVTTLTSNLKQALVLNDAAADNSRFVLQTKIAELSKDVTSTAPPMFVTELEISLFHLGIIDIDIPRIVEHSGVAVYGQLVEVPVAKLLVALFIDKRTDTAVGCKS